MLIINLLIDNWKLGSPATVRLGTGGLGMQVCWIVICKHCTKHSFCTRNWTPARGHEGDLIFTSRTSAKGTRLRWTWTSTGGKALPTIDHAGECDLHWGLERGEENRWLAPGRIVLTGKKTTRRIGWERLHLEYVAIETVTPIWACTDQTDAVLPSTAEA